MTRRPLALAAPLGLLLIAALIASAFLPATANAWIMKRLDYESGNLSQWRYVQALPGRITVVKSPKRQGQFAARFEVRSGDHPVGGTGERAELVSMTGEHRGTNTWWRWSTYFPSSFNPVHGTWNIFQQWHQTGDRCPPNVQFTIDASKSPPRMHLKVRGGRLGSNCGATYRRSFPIGYLRLGRWYQFVFHVKWSPYKSGGYVRLWVNGRSRARAHTGTLYKGQGVYVKQGFYRGPSSKTSVIYHDGLQRFHP